MEQKYNEKKCLQCGDIKDYLKLPSKVCKECVELLILYYEKHDYDVLKKCGMCKKRFPFLNLVCNTCAMPLTN